MEIFIGNIPSEMNGYELRRFVNGILDSRKPSIWPFMRNKEPGELSFKIVEKHTASGSYRYAVATVEPKSVALECIALMDKRLFRDNELEVREYIPRSYMNERRAVNWREKAWNGIERRMGDRRQVAIASGSSAVMTTNSVQHL